MPTLCWGFAVTLAITTVGWASGAHLNPAVSLGFCVIGHTEWQLLPFYFLGQFAGWAIGGLILCIIFMPHFNDTKSFEVKRNIFVTSGQYERNHIFNFLTEFVCSFLLVFCLLGIVNQKNNLTSGSVPVLIGILIATLNGALGGSTGASMNPARDLGPRFAFWVIYGIKEKGDMQWWYAALNLVTPLIAGIAAAELYQGTVNKFN